MNPLHTDILTFTFEHEINVEQITVFDIQEAIKLGHAYRTLHKVGFW